jgi:hypothetical protein
MRRIPRSTPLLTVAMALTVAAALTSSCASGSPATSRPVPKISSAHAAGGVLAGGGNCSAAASDTPLPTWARAGFSNPTGDQPHVLGARGDIVAILWAKKDALHAPPLAHQNNKILWVSRLSQRPTSPLKIEAVLAGRHTIVYREVAGGPGPSYVNLPAAGCWTLELSWSGHTDQVRLRYVA